MSTHPFSVAPLIKAHWEKNLDLLGLPANARKDPVEWRDITTASSVELAQMRQGLKTKVHRLMLLVAQMLIFTPGP